MIDKKRLLKLMKTEAKLTKKIKKLERHPAPPAKDIQVLESQISELKKTQHQILDSYKTYIYNQ